MMDRFYLWAFWLRRGGIGFWQFVVRGKRYE